MPCCTLHRAAYYEENEVFFLFLYDKKDEINLKTKGGFFL